MKKKIWSGERLETYIFNENTLEHLHRYAFAMKLTKGKKILDIACGEGYGSYLLAEEAKTVTGVDISDNAITSAKKTYNKQNLSFLVGTTSKIPLSNSSVDVVVSFETIEHHDEHEQMFKEIKRVLSPGGILILSSPDKRTYTDLTGVHNPHHVKELYFDEFRNLVEKHFSHSSFSFQKVVNGSFIYPDKINDNAIAEYEGDFVQINELKDLKPLYNIAIASDEQVPKTEVSHFYSEKVIKQLNDIIVQKVKSSHSYKLGHLLLSPLRILRKNA